MSAILPSHFSSWILIPAQRVAIQQGQVSGWGNSAEWGKRKRKLANSTGRSHLSNKSQQSQLALSWLIYCFSNLSWAIYILAKDRHWSCRRLLKNAADCKYSWACIFKDDLGFSSQTRHTCIAVRHSQGREFIVIASTTNVIVGRKAEVADYLMETFWFLDHQNMHWQRSGSLLDCKLLGWGGKGTTWNGKAQADTATKRFRILGFVDLSHPRDVPSTVMFSAELGFVELFVAFTEFFNVIPLYKWIFPEKRSSVNETPSAFQWMCFIPNQTCWWSIPIVTSSGHFHEVLDTLL